MLKAEDNFKITQTGPDSSAGRLLRRYWQPVGLEQELEHIRPAKPIRVLGEDLVLFRDTDGEIGLVGRYCPHRGVDLAYGRLEHGGLRCLFHGWLFDRKGACLEQPAEPIESNYYKKIHHKAYPCRVINGMIFAWMGPANSPPMPVLDALNAPESHCFAYKGLIEANWLQATEVGIDPAHASFLHRFFEDDDPSDSYGQQFRDTTVGAKIPVTELLRKHHRPEITIEKTDYGLRIFARRDLQSAGQHIRVTNLVFPSAIVIPMQTDMTITQWHVPIDNERTYWYGLFCSYGEAVDKAKMKEQRDALYDTHIYRPKRNSENGYGFNPDEQKKVTYTGMGMDINVHDNWAVESPGPIQDRTKEHLGTTDRAIIANRRTLLQRIDELENGKEPPVPKFEDGPPLAIDTLCSADDWKSFWRTTAEGRRQSASWAAGSD
ncbi:MAG: ring-hydroxylating oxygenase subunit alpha [Rhodospirillaceae bacterium]|nr:ring-hydroxylating oxygenase subunit alpha [Rhodospirillaceae bacterium]|tara:strand:+ start:2275 stop:3576 length:1302 start_codon:yes stop_codon:yes gene_type:complete